MSEHSGLDLIDLDHYPIHTLDSAAGRNLVSSCHRDLREKALCLLPGFIKQSMLGRMTEEITPLPPDGICHDGEFGFGYDGLIDEAFPLGHPRRLKFPDRFKRLLNHQISNDALLRKLYLCEALTEFVRRVFGSKTLYLSQCPHLSLTVKVEAEGDTDGWHYDTNDAVISLLLQQASCGGEFEYAPYIRTERDECYDAVSRMLANPDEFAERPTLEAGTFVLFNGKLSLHRVTPVGTTDQPRIVALFSYDQKPDFVTEQSYIDHLKTLPRARALELTSGSV